MKKRVDLNDMYDIYSKQKSISQIKQSMLLSEGEVDLVPTTKAGIKFNYENEDAELVPTTFQLDFSTKVVFNLEAVLEDFSEQVSADYLGSDFTAKKSTKVAKNLKRSKFAKAAFSKANNSQDELPKDATALYEGDDEESEDGEFKSDEMSDDEIAKLADKSMATAGEPAEPIEPKKIILDKNRIYRDIFRKKLSDYAVYLKIQEMTKAGVFSFGDFFISDVTYSTRYDLKVLYRNFITKYAENPNGPIKLQFGYALTLTSKNEEKVYNEEECLEVAKIVAAKFEDVFLAKKKYFDFSTK